VAALVAHPCDGASGARRSQWTLECARYGPAHACSASDGLLQHGGDGHRTRPLDRPLEVRGLKRTIDRISAACRRIGIDLARQFVELGVAVGRSDAG
jgi:hypothetical protein